MPEHCDYNYNDGDDLNHYCYCYQHGSCYCTVAAAAAAYNNCQDYLKRTYTIPFTGHCLRCAARCCLVFRALICKIVLWCCATGRIPVQGLRLASLSGRTKAKRPKQRVPPLAGGLGRGSASHERMPRMPPRHQCMLEILESCIEDQWH